MIAAMKTLPTGRLFRPGPIATGDVFDGFALGVDDPHQGAVVVRFAKDAPVLLIAGHDESLDTLRGRLKCSGYRAAGGGWFQGKGDRRRFRWLVIRRGSLVAGKRRSQVARIATLTSAP